MGDEDQSEDQSEEQEQDEESNAVKTQEEIEEDTIAEEMYATPHDTISLLPLALWIGFLYRLVFYRQMFLKVKDYPTFIYIQLLQLAQDFFMYPFRMSVFYESTSLRAAQYFSRFTSYFSKSPPPAPSSPTLTAVTLSLSRVRFNLCMRYYWIAMAQRVSATSFALFVTILRFNYNAPMFPFVEFSSNEYQQLMQFCLFMFLIEWTVSTVTTVCIALIYRQNVVRIGGAVLLHPNMLKMCVLFATYIFMNLFVNINELEFCPAL
eukprot:TRINITY_DN4460_c0_g1_i4.p1 TRINITY_DN4460_c0_g1~~TRINITY_DN4460_c0_g1_i4.p1  ORF type:complete len:272 (-),score=63.55 TRINITY_DN4460_c0_g1_i4:32-823(-)